MPSGQLRALIAGQVARIWQGSAERGQPYPSWSPGWGDTFLPFDMLSKKGLCFRLRNWRA